VAGEQLRVVEGEQSGAVVEVDSELLLGRAATGTAGRLGDDPLLSRRHARISREPSGQLTIEDMGSANGTFVNDERIESPRPLAFGDRVRLGRTVSEVTDGSGQVPAKTLLEDQPTVADPGAAPREELLVTGGPAQGRRIDVEDELVVGRAAEEEGGLGDDPGLSRRHARFSREGGRLSVEDIGSANGTFVNGARITEARPLEIGDSVTVAQTVLEVVEAGQPGERAEARTPALPREPSPAASPAPSRARAPDPPRAPAPPQPPAPGEQAEEKSGGSNVLAAVGLIVVVVLLMVIIIALG